MSSHSAFNELPSSGPPNGYWTPAALLVLGILATGLVLRASRLSEHEVIQDLTIARAIRQLEVAVDTSRWWLEEEATGEPSIDVEEIGEGLDRSAELVLLMLHGGSADPGGYLLEPLREGDLRRRAEGLRARLVELKGSFTGPTSRADREQSFEAELLDLLRLHDHLRQDLAERTLRWRARSRLRLNVVVLAWVTLVSAASAGLYHKERRRRHAVLTLRRREAELDQAQTMEAGGRLPGDIAHDGIAHDGIARDYRPAASSVIDLNEVVTKIEGMARPLLGDGVILSTEKDPGLWPVELDPFQAEQVLLNLLVNSRDAMPRGGKIVVTTSNGVRGAAPRGERPPLPPGRYAALSVVDTGSGIPPEIQEKIFEPFFTTKPKTGSSGLGLATVYRIVRGGGGLITVASEPGRGTTFEILLPAHGRQAGAERQAEAGSE